MTAKEPWKPVEEDPVTRARIELEKTLAPYNITRDVVKAIDALIVARIQEAIR